MGFKSEGLLAGFILNAMLAPILLILSYFLQNKNKLGSILLWKVFRPLRPDEPPTFFNFGGCGDGERSTVMKTMFRLSDPWLRRIQGDEVNLYLSYLKLCMMMFMPVGCIVLLTLAPLNESSDYLEKYTVFELEENYTPGVGDWTSRNIDSKSSRWWGVFILSLLVTAEMYGLIINLMHQLRRVKARQQPRRTAEIKKVYTMEKAKEKIPADFLDLIEHIELPKRPVEGMMETMEKRENAIAQLEHFYALCEKEEITGEDRFTHEDLLIKTSFCCGDKVNAITYWRNKVDTYHERLVEFKKLVEDQGSMGVAYVTFREPRDCARFIMEVNTGPLNTAWFAPIAKNIIWENAEVGTISYYARSFLTMVVLFFAVLLWGALVGFLGSIDEFSKYIPGLDPIIETKQEIRDAVTTYAPIIALAVLMIFLPRIMRAWTQYIEVVPDKTEREQRVLRKLYIFLLITAVLLQALLQGAGDSLDVLFEMNTTEMIATFTNMIVPTSGYFAVTVLQAAFGGNLIRATRIGDVIVSPILAMFALTQRERDDAYSKRPFYFSEEYSFTMLVFSFAILFSVNVPYIPILGFFYFVLRFLVDRATLADAYPVCRDSDLRMVPTVVNFITTLLFLVQFMGVTVLCLNKERWDVFYVSLVPCVMTLCLVAWVWKAGTYTMGPQLLKDVANGTYCDPQDAPTLCNLVATAVWGNNNDIFNAEFEPSKTMIISDATEEYRHPCATFEPVSLDHDTMASKSWLVKASDSECISFEITPSSVCFSNPKPPCVDSPKEEKVVVEECEDEQKPSEGTHEPVEPVKNEE